MMSSSKKSLELNNGLPLPLIGLGVFLNPPEQTSDAVTTAIKAGYRLIDTAAAYHNEKQVGEGIKRSGISRNELFITTKLWMTDYGYDAALKAFDVSLKKLGLDYLDLYLLHWPAPADFTRTIQSYKAAEQLLREGRVKAIGVSNFNENHLKALIAETEVIPAVNQIECNPYFSLTELQAVHKHLGIATQAWSPIGGVYDRNKNAQGHNNVRHPLQHPAISAIAEAHHKTPAQVILRWHVEKGVSAIPKSVNATRIAENIDIFDFSLTPSEIALIDALNVGVRAGSDPDNVNAETFPIKISEQ